MRKFVIALILLLSMPAYASQITTHYNLEIPAAGDWDWTDEISKDIISIDAGLYILSEDVTTNTILGTILSNDAVAQDNKITIISNDATIQDNKITIISNDATDWESTVTKATILSNDAAWTKSGTNVSLITSSNSVGIGNSSPSALLEIKGSTKTVFVDQNSDARAVDVDAENTTAYAINVQCDALTTGATAFFGSNSSSTSSRNLVYILNDNTAATGTYCLAVDNDSTGGAISVISGDIELNKGMVRMTAKTTSPDASGKPGIYVDASNNLVFYNGTVWKKVTLE